jgi:hypothetical protein
MNGAPEVEVGGVVFKYAELRTGSRGIKIWTAGARPVEYKLRPDPHESREYNKKQERFYLELATAIGGLFNAAPGAWPPYGTQVHVALTDEDYALDQP